MNTGFRTYLKGKIVLVFLISLAALTGSYFIYKFAFQKIRSSVADLSYTNRKLIIVNNVFSEINESEKSFRNLINNDSSFDAFLTRSRQLKYDTDSLRKLCLDNPYQLALIDSINGLCHIRQKFLLGYVDFRRGLRSNNTLVRQAKMLDSLILIDKAQVDSLVFSKEQHQSTTRIDSLEQEEPEKKGLWKRLFGSKKKTPVRFNKVVQEEVKTRIDTIVQLKKNQVAEEAQRIIDEIGSEQSSRRKRFLKRETELSRFENAFHSQITSLLSEIEKDITRQTELTHDRAERNIGRSITRVSVLMGIFLLFALVITLLMLTDITRSNRYRLLLEEARADAESRSLSWQRFLLNMSHEIRTPLQSIIGYTEQLSGQAKPDPEYIRIIRHSSGHLLQVINEILDYNKIHSGKFVFERTDFDLRAVINEVLSLLQYQAEQKGILLLCEEELPAGSYLSGDPFRLTQILLNLAGNAVKFTEQGRVVLHVKTEDTGGGIWLTGTVSDTGPGIPYAMQGTIFDQFEQADLPREQRYKGTGLGLGIVKALVEGQGGNIEVISEPGLGACFRFRIRYGKAVGPPVHKVAAAVSYDHKGEVWLVDDDKLILQLCAVILEKQGIAYRCFNSAEAVLAFHPETIPTLILADIRMPGLNGFQLYEMLRERYNAAGTAIVALTAQAMPEEQAQMLQHGFDGILLKPFREDQLLSLLQRRPDEAANSSAATDDTDAAWQEILRSYIQETAIDMHMLEAQVQPDNWETAALLLHRLAGRTAQVGYKETGRLIRKAELSVREQQYADPAMIAEVTAVLLRLLDELRSPVS